MIQLGRFVEFSVFAHDVTDWSISDQATGCSGVHLGLYQYRFVIDAILDRSRQGVVTHKLQLEIEEGFE
jgi:hypothetical protein